VLSVLHMQQVLPEVLAIHGLGVSEAACGLLRRLFGSVQMNARSHGKAG
jgi:hypothetical protein